METTDRHENVNEYTATVLWTIGRMMGGAEYGIPPFSEFIDPSTVDRRGEKEIISGVIEKLKGKEVKNRNGNG